MVSDKIENYFNLIKLNFYWLWPFRGNISSTSPKKLFFLQATLWLPHRRSTSTVHQRRPYVQRLPSTSRLHRSFIGDIRTRAPCHLPLLTLDHFRFHLMPSLISRPTDQRWWVSTPFHEHFSYMLCTPTNISTFSRQKIFLFVPLTITFIFCTNFGRFHFSDFEKLFFFFLFFLSICLANTRNYLPLNSKVPIDSYY